MSALTADRDSSRRVHDFYDYPWAASEVFYKGAIIFLDTSGNAEAATAAAGKEIAGISQEGKTATAVAAAGTIKVRKGVHYLANSAVNTITKAHIGDTAYAEDDQTVGTSGTTKSPVGMIVDLDSNGVWVLVGALPTAGLLAANNLSDVGTVATARASLGLDTADTPTFADVTTTDDVIVGDDLSVAGLATVGETLAVTGITTLTAQLVSPTITVAKVDISVAQMVDLVANPHELVAAAGADKIIEFLGAAMFLDYGAAQYTESSDDLIVKYVDGSGLAASLTYETTGSFLVAAADGFGTVGRDQQMLIGTVAQVVNTALVLTNSSGDFGGGTGSVVTVFTSYRVHDVS